MGNSTMIWIAVVILAALCGAVYLKFKDDQKIGTSQTTSGEIPDIKVPDDVDKISITNGEKGEIVVEKKGDQWHVTKPVDAPASQANVKSLVDNLKDLKAKEIIAPTPTEESKKDYEFGPKAVHVQAWKGGDKKIDIQFGKSGSRGQMAMIEGKEPIYAVTGYSSYLYTREVKGFRDTDVMKFDDATANQMTIEKKDGTLSFTKDGEKWSGTWKGKPIERFDEEKVKDALRAFKNVTADDFADGKPDTDTGLSEPESKVTVTLKDNAGKYVLKVGKVASGSNRFAVREGNDTQYVLPSYTADWAIADVAKFQRPADAGAPAAGSDAGKPGDDMKLKMPEMPPGHPDPHGH